MLKSKRNLLSAIVVSVIAGAIAMPTFAADKKIVFGFAQIGAESEWRAANTASIKEAAPKAGIELKFSDAQQKQEN